MAQRLRISGRVQGVGFRAALASEARRLRLTGWVRNRGDGSVEAHVEGDAAAVDQLVAWARRGPPGARVTRVDVIAAGDEAADGFVIRPTRD